jgi:hypothetical protein
MQSPMRDAHTLVPEAAVSPEDEPDRCERRRTDQSDSRLTLPSADATKTPRQS